MLRAHSTAVSAVEKGLKKKSYGKIIIIGHVKQQR